MDFEVTEQWIGNIAGWKAFKAGRDLWKSGAVRSAEWNAEQSEFVGEVGSQQKPRRLRVVVHGQHDVENKCSCMVARRTGEICSHAVALMLQAVSGEPARREDWAQPAKEVAAPPAFEAARLRVELPPHFPQRLEKGITVRIVQQEGEPSHFDLRVCAWLHSLGLQEIPPMLPIRAEGVWAFLQALEGHDTVIAGELPVRVLAHSVSLPVKATLDGDRVGLQLSTPDGVEYLCLSESLAVWDGGQRCVGLATLQRSSLKQGQIERLGKGGLLYLQVKSFIRDFEQWERAFDWTESNLLEDLRLLPAAAHPKLQLEGNLSKLTGVLSFRYPGGLHVKSGSSADEMAFPIQDKNREGVWWVRNRAAEQQACDVLRGYGFSESSSGTWLLEDEDDVLGFIGEGLAELKRSWTVDSGGRLESQRGNLVRVKPDIKIEGTGQDWLAFDYGFQTEDGKAIPREAIEKMLRAGKRTATTKNGKRIHLSSFDASLMEEVLRDVDPRQQGGRYYVSPNQGAYLQRLRQFYGKGLQTVSESCIDELPVEVSGLLREYQREGIAWMWQRVKTESAALMADDMGLGKTLQTLALLHLIGKQDSSPALVICPTSLLSNWQEEAERFFAGIKVTIMHGPDRQGMFAKLGSSDLVITSYGLLARDLEHYQRHQFAALVIDEASMIRNPDTQAAKALRKLTVEKRIALTGTPVENALQDLWSIYEFLMPGYLGSREDFKRRYVKPCSGAPADSSVLKRLRMRVEPFMLRRTKAEVASDLPAKMEQVVWCEPTAEQQAVYKSVHQKGVEQVAQSGKQGKGRAKIQMLTVLLRLRQVCCDLRLLGEDTKALKTEQASVKLVRLLELVEQAVAGGHRILIFSQFTSMLALIKQAMEDAGHRYCYLDGATANRSKVVSDFQQRDGPVAFLISLKAGGYGLNLTAADMVVHFDPWWNPAVEAQATDRAYRIGQTKPVNVYKLVAKGTVEEKILKLQEQKKSLIGATVDEEVMMSGLTSAEIDSILV